MSLFDKCIWAFFFGLCFGLIAFYAHAHDRHAAPISKEMKQWFDGLKSGRGPCCSDADGNVVKDADWRTKDGKYEVFVEGKWVEVPEDAVINQPNLYGQTMVWLMGAPFGGTSIRCFMVGAGG